MKKYVHQIGIVVTLCLIAGFAVWYIQNTHHIVLRLPNGFFPKIVHTEKGESLTFINATLQPTWPASGPHPNHTNYPDFDAREGITPGHFWTFTFAQEGAFTFHDHFAPQMHGIVISGQNDISDVTDQNTCDTLLDPHQQASCIETYFRNISESVGYLEARAIYEDVAARYPNSCHSFAHDLGKNAYTAYLENTLPEIEQEASSCAYGLWHGFTTAMQADRGFESSKEFCATFGGSTNELQVINRMNCYHGIGIGLIPDPPPPNSWGKFQQVITPALNFCDTVTGDPLYKERCLTGVFHAMTTYMTNNLYGFAFDEDALANCTAQKTEHQYTCFITLVSAVPKLTNQNLERTVAILKKYSPSQDLFRDMFINAAIMSVDVETGVEEMGYFIERCRTLGADLRPKCISAVIISIYAGGAPGVEYQKTIAFCEGGWIQLTEQEACFSEVISHASTMYTPEKLMSVCDLIPNQYRSHVSKCTIR